MMGQKLTVSARETSPMDDAGFISVVLSYNMALVSPNRTLAVLRCSAPDQALAVRCLERCASRPLTLPRLPPPVAVGGVPCTTWDMVIIGASIFTLMSPIAVLNSSRGTFAEASMVSGCPFFGALGTNRLALETLECSRVQDFCKNLKAEANSCKAGKCGTSR